MTDSEITPEVSCPHCSKLMPSHAVRCRYCLRSVYDTPKSGSDERASRIAHQPSGTTVVGGGRILAIIAFTLYGLLLLWSNDRAFESRWANCKAVCYSEKKEPLQPPTGTTSDSSVDGSRTPNDKSLDCRCVNAPSQAKQKE